MTVAIVYTNHRGETATRRIIPQQIRFGTSEWYVGEQWFLDAYDLDRKANRSFAMRAIQSWEPWQIACEADVRTLATALNDIAQCRTEEEASAVLAEVLPYYKECVQPTEQGGER